MANVKKNTRESLVKKAVEMVKERGIDSLGIRSFAEYAGISTQPVYLNFGNFQGLKEAVISEINDLYEDFSKKEIEKGKYPPYKASGVAYVNFARVHPELFKILFMRSRKGEATKKADEYFDEKAKEVSNNLGLEEKKARDFHFLMWVIVHGMATQIATDYLSIDEETVSEVLTRAYTALADKNPNRTRL